MKERGQIQHAGGENRCSSEKESVAGRQTLCEWSNSNLVPLPVSLRVGRWQALILPSDCLCQRCVKETFLEFSMLNVWKVTRRIQGDCAQSAHAKQLEVFYVLTDRDIPSLTVLAVCVLYYRQTGVCNTCRKESLIFQSCWTLAAVQKPLFFSPGVLLSLGKSSHADTVIVCVCVCVHHRDWLSELIWPSHSEKGDGTDAVSWRYAAIWWRSLI